MSGGKYTSEYRALATCLVPAKSKLDLYKTMTVSCFVLDVRPVGKLGSESLEITFTAHAQNTIRMLRCVSCFDTCQSTTKALTRKHGETRSKRSCRQLKQFFCYSERKEIEISTILKMYNFLFVRQSKADVKCKQHLVLLDHI